MRVLSRGEDGTEQIMFVKRMLLHIAEIFLNFYTLKFHFEGIRLKSYPSLQHKTDTGEVFRSAPNRFT